MTILRSGLAGLLAFGAALPAGRRSRCTGRA